MRIEKKKLHIVSLFYFNSNIAGKDMFLVPMYLGQQLGATVEFVYPKKKDNEEYSDYYRDVKLTPINSLSKYESSFWSEKEMVWWLIKNARRINILSLFWLNKRNILFATIYKLLNPSGICYIKGDMSEVKLYNPKSIKDRISHFLYKNIDVLSVETNDVFHKIKEGIMGKHLASHTILMSNGFDVDLFESFRIKKKTFEQKENIAITVGRIGTTEKNNLMMLKALDGVDLNNWQYWFIGPVESGFIADYNKFITSNPDKQDSVKLIGCIYDKQELWDIYNKSKAFVLTSPKECMAQVFSEALAFGNYIITTNVQGAFEITDGQRLGRIIDVDDVTSLKNILQSIFNDDSVIKKNVKESHYLSETKYNWRDLTRVLANEIIRINDEKNN